ncbi:PHD finger protein 3 [Entophlyctis sp. JEL0112]|nr:PHD finger protein 3 [Entophlyctis sp. JEL0112]
MATSDPIATDHAADTATGWGLPLDYSSATVVNDYDPDVPPTLSGGEADAVDTPDSSETPSYSSNFNVKQLVREHKQPYNEKGERVYCICRDIDNGKFMIQCDSCKDWYHGACVNITERMGQSLSSYDCPYCVQAKTGAAILQPEASGSLQSRSAQHPAAPTVPTAPPRQRQRHSTNAALASAARSKSEPDVGPNSMAWIHDKTRSLVRKSFGEVLRSITDELRVSGDDSNLLDTTELAGTMEDELFDLTSDGEFGKGSGRSCGDKYKSKFRSLQFNLKDKKNSTLRHRLVRGQLSPYALVRLEAKDLANDEIKARAAESRIIAIRDAVKPKEVNVMYKKTHKGDEEIQPEPVAVAPQTSGASVPPKRSLIRDEDEDSVSAPPVPTISLSSSHHQFPAGIAGIVAAAEAAAAKNAVRVGPASAKPAKIETLDDLLSNIDGSSSDKEQSKAGTKRNGTTPTGESDQKKGRVDAPIPSTGASHGMSSTAGWDNIGVMDSWGSAGMAYGADGPDASEDISWMRSPGHSGFTDDMKDVTRTASVPSENGVVWSGTVRMPQVGRFNGNCKQIAGRLVSGAGSSAMRKWEDLLPPTVFIEGRIDTKRTLAYIDHQKLSTSKEVIAVQFFPDSGGDEISTTLAAEAGENGGEAGFRALFDYFIEKQRYAVVGQKYVSVRDMYLLPVRAGESVPQTLTVLSKFNVVDKSSHEDRLFGVMILDKAFFAGSGNGSVGAVAGKSVNGLGKPSDSAASHFSSHSARVVPAAPVAVAAAAPGGWPGFPMPGVSLPLVSVPVLQPAPVASAPSATALALLMQLQRQQQQQQQQQQSLPASSVPQGIAGLLSQIQASQRNQQPSYGASVYSGASVYGGGSGK